MVKTWDELEAICNRLAARLYDAPVDLTGVIDVATTLGFVTRELRRVIARERAIYGPTKRLGAAEVGVDAVERRLRWLREDGATAPEATIRVTVDKLLRLVVRVMGLIERQHAHFHNA